MEVYQFYAPCKRKMSDNYENKPGEETEGAVEEVTTNATIETGEPFPSSTEDPYISSAFTTEAALEAPKKKNKMFLALGGGIAILAILLVGIFSLAGRGAGLSGNKGIVSQAISNTMKDQSQFIKAFNFEALGNIVKNKDYALSLEASSGYYKGSISYNEKGDSKQFSGNVGMSFLQLDIVGEITPTLIKMQIPMVHDRILTYDYTAEKTGAIVDYVGKEQLDQIDSIFKAQGVSDSEKAASEKFDKAIMEEFRSIDMNKIDKRDFTVNGESKSSNGYRMVITKTNVNNVLNATEELFKLSYPEGVSNAGDVETMVEEARAEIEGMEDLYLDFYIYDKKLSAIVIADKNQEYEVQVLFEGGGRRTELVKLVMIKDGNIDTEISIAGKTEGNIETHTLSVTEYGETAEMGSIVYDTKSGEFKVQQANGYPEVLLQGTIKAEKNQWQLSFKQEMEDPEFPEIGIAITIKKGADIKKLEGTEFNIGTASDEELQNILQEYLGFFFGL